jgi:hypothetical protein
VADPIERNGNSRTVELTARELRLLLKYGSPWPEDEQKLRASQAVDGYHRLRIDAYWIEMMIADLVRSAKKIHNRALLDELDALGCALESALARRA